jgi:hypothetical protein
LGEVGDANTPCTKIDSSDSDITGSSTYSNDILDGLSKTTKLCPASCSGNGICYARLKSSGEFYPISLDIIDCSLADVDCLPECLCNNGWAGSTCSIDYEELEQRRSIKEQLFISLDIVSESEDLTEDTVSSQL